MSKILEGWDISSGSGGAKVEFTKFPEGLTEVRLIDTVPHIRWTHWVNVQRKSVTCPTNCAICKIRKEQKENNIEYTYSMSRRFALQVLNRNTGKVEIMEQGITFFEDLKIVLMMAVEEGIPIDEVDLKVRRSGVSKDGTSYRIDLGKQYALTDSDKELIENNVVNLEEYFAPHTKDQVQRIVNGEDWASVMSTEDEVETIEPDDEVILK